ITRDAVLQIARDQGYRIEVRALHFADLHSASEAFFTGTAAEVTPIREVDGAAIGTGRRGPVTEKIQSIFFAATAGRDERYKDWLHPIESRAVENVSELLQEVV
ncbi:MAG: aminotransferase class IV, partial [Pyrinomonadaceae bacterium]